MFLKIVEQEMNARIHSSPVTDKLAISARMQDVHEGRNTDDLDK